MGKLELDEKIKSLQLQARRSMRNVNAKVENMQRSVDDAQWRAKEEGHKFQRTVKVALFKMTTACDGFCEHVHETFQCVREKLTTTHEQEKQKLKDRCVIVNDWNTGVNNKRSKIEHQTAGESVQIYEPRVPKSSNKHRELSLVDDDMLEFCDEDHARTQSRRREEEVREEDFSIEEDDDIDENVSDDNDWYAQGMKKKTWPMQVENEVVVSKKKGEQRSSFFGGEESRNETLDQLIGVFKRNMTEHYLE
ncbi:MAG: hypothetical protein SGILL_000106 [Bacillariaceae sp.]